MLPILSQSVTKLGNRQPSYPPRINRKTYHPCWKVNTFPNKPLFRRFDSLSSRPRRGPEKTLSGFLRGLRPYPRPPRAVPFHISYSSRLVCLKVNKCPNKPLFRRFHSLSSRPRRGPKKSILPSLRGPLALPSTAVGSILSYSYSS